MRYVLSLAIAATVVNAQLISQLQSSNSGFYDAGKQGCISAPENADGAPVVIHDCNTEDVAKHSWAVIPWSPGRQSTNSLPNPVKIYGDKCLDVKDGVNADGAKLQLWTCVPGSTNQLWISVTDNTWNWAGTNKCIDLTDGNIADGTQLQLWTCSQGPNQRFENYRVPNDENQPDMFWAGDADISRPSMCLTAETNADGAPVALSECGSAGKATFPDGSQTWVWARDPLTGLVKTFDGTKCLDVPSGDATNGKRLQIWSCDKSNPNQQFRVQNPWPWAIKWAGGNKCLETPNGNFTAGTLIEISDCDSSKVSQHWF